VIEDLPRAARGQAALWDNYQRMVAGRDGQLYAFNPTRGVAALPSLHVGAHVLFFLWARRFAPVLSPLFLAAGVLTFVGSMVTGWHYAVDGYAGAGLAILAYAVARRLEPVAPPALPVEEPGGGKAAGAAAARGVETSGVL
jgi:hypothetical protein